MKIATGIYQTTNAFRQIEAHCAVLEAQTGGLIAITGRHDDPEAASYAILFAAAPDLLAELRAIKGICEQTASLLRKELAPVTHAGQAHLFESLAERAGKAITFSEPVEPGKESV